MCVYTEACVWRCGLIITIDEWSGLGYSCVRVAWGHGCGRRCRGGWRFGVTMQQCYDTWLGLGTAQPKNGCCLGIYMQLLEEHSNDVIVKYIWTYGRLYRPHVTLYAQLWEPQPFRVAILCNFCIIDM